MSALAGALIGVLAAVGCWVAVAGWRGIEVRERKPLTLNWSRSGLIAVAGVGAGLVVWLVTGWPAAGLVAAAIAVIVPNMLGARRDRNEAIERSEALASWAEMLRDTISAHAGLREAVALTAKVAPAAIRPQVQALSVRAERQSMTDALRQFAADVNDPLADLIVSALVIASERQAQGLGTLLGHIASSAREQSAMRMRVETGRARTYASARALVVITFALCVALMVMSPEFMEPFDSFGGQIALLVIGACFTGALWALVQMGRPVEQPRLLAGIEPGQELI